MRRYLMLCVLALVPVLAMLGLQDPISGAGDYRIDGFPRGRVGYSAEDIAQALFPRNISAAYTRYWAHHRRARPCPPSVLR